jgi:hypothetical protein
MKTSTNKIQIKNILVVILFSTTILSCTKDDQSITTKSPQNVSPETEQTFSTEEAQSPITFRWTPLVPKPQSAVLYRLKVWQLMQGQNGSQAIRTNQPIVTKDVDNITEVQISGIYTGPCRPPYLCDFVWTVQAISIDGSTIGANNGTSIPTLFHF